MVAGCTILQSPNLNYCFRSEQYFGSPSETAAAAEGVRERLLLVEERRLQLQEARLDNEEEDEEEGRVLNGQDGRLDVIGEELSEKEEQEEEEEEEVTEEETEEARQQDEDLERGTQDC